MASNKVVHHTLEERRALGRLARDRTPPSSHKGWAPAMDRPDPVTLLEEQNATREADLVPVRHGRMMVSPFTFYRGGAKIMATDLKDTPTAGLHVQLCGDAHLSNFGFYASPERRLLFDVNDFDETLPGPFEYDVKRMTASFTIASRHCGHTKAETKAAARASVAAYREAMAGFAQMRTMDIWYSRVDEEDIATAARSMAKAKAISTDVRRGERNIEKARTRDSLQALSKLAETVDGTHRIVSRPPIVVPMRDLAETYGLSPDAIQSAVHAQFRAYRSTLQPDRRDLLERFQVVDVARKVVGVGSVGTRAFIVLLQGRDDGDPLFLQVKEATRSVLEDHLPKSRYTQHGERVVQGQRRMQAASDVFLGWTRGLDTSRYYYWRQLRDMKGSALVESMSPAAIEFYAGLCGWTLARAHARSGDPVAISSYLGDSDVFDRAIVDFAKRYADQNERDYQAFVDSIGSGRLAAVEGV
jgi:uncharacterized protein (DUF2252 family)